MLRLLQLRHPAPVLETNQRVDHATNLPMTGDSFLTALRASVGHRNVLTHPNQTRRFRTGYRFGGGDVLAVVQPGSLVEQWRVLQLRISAGKIIIMQAANTGLTGGSTPDGNDY